MLKLVGPADPLRMVLVRDMWLTSFDTPSLHTMYDALGVNDSAVQVLADGTLRDIARELVETVRGNVTSDWTLREYIRANLRRLVRRVLRKHGYPPDKQEAAIRTVLKQAEALSAVWAA
jgi:type I restriction enzyme R subunit